MRTNFDGPASYHHGSLHQVLLREAQSLLKNGGPEKVTLRGVAKRAGVSAAAPYHHFTDKEALLAAVVEEGFRGLSAAMLDQAAHADTSSEHLVCIGVGYVLYAVGNPHLFRLMHGPQFCGTEAYPNVKATAAESYTILQEAIRACAPRAEEEQIELTCAAAWALVHGVANLLIDGRLQDLEDRFDLPTLVQLVVMHLNIAITANLPSDAILPVPVPAT